MYSKKYSEDELDQFIQHTNLLGFNLERVFERTLINAVPFYSRRFRRG